MTVFPLNSPPGADSDGEDESKMRDRHEISHVLTILFIFFFHSLCFREIIV